MDVVLQSSNQTQAHRIVLYSNDSSLNMFPKEGYGEEAVEVGPYADHKGPCLALLKDVKVQPDVFLSWMTGSLLERHVHRLYWLDPKVPSAASVSEVAAAAVEMAPNEGSVRIMGAPRKLEMEIANALPLDFPLEPRDNTHVLAVIQAEGRLRYTITPMAINYRQTPCEPKSFADHCSTAVNKLEEALTILNVKLDKTQLAIDLGAAPGAWTEYLAKRAGHVFSVDPAELSPTVLQLQNVSHVQCKSEHCIPYIQKLANGSKVDLVVCDMNQHPFQALKTVKAVLPIVKSKGLVLCTLKFFGAGRDRTEKLKAVQGELADDVQDVKFVWLMSNRKCERTLIAWKK